MIKRFDTPTHAYVSMDIAGKPQTGESIYAGGLVYAKLVYAKYDGKWTAGGTTKEIKEIAEKNRQNNQTTCPYLKDEPVNGEMAAVYSVHEVSPRSTSDSKTWISKAKGLRSDIDLAGVKPRRASRKGLNRLRESAGSKPRPSPNSGWRKSAGGKTASRPACTGAFAG